MRRLLPVLPLLLLAATAQAALNVEKQGLRTIVTGDRYRATFQHETGGFTLELSDAGGAWQKVGAVGPTLFANDHEQGVAGRRCVSVVQVQAELVVVGQRLSLAGAQVELHYLCRTEGVLIGALVSGADTKQTLWLPGRVTLNGAQWDQTLFWAAGGQVHRKATAELAPTPAYAGASPWGNNGDTAAALDPAHPAVITGCGAWGSGLGVVLVDYAARWTAGRSFVQRYTPEHILFYTGYLPAAQATRRIWAWLAPLPADAAVAAPRVEALAQQGAKLAADFQPVAPALPESWTRALPDFPAGLHRGTPVTDINDAIVYTMAETTRSAGALDLARKVGSDMLVRGWFKWHTSPGFAQWKEIPQQAHAAGALFGGGITCSALYDTENHITRAQLLDMATRGPDGNLVDAWDQPGCRHGSLSSPAYLDYLYRWCKEQIDLGVDYLFMDEITAALSGEEGFDDHSLADFRTWLTDGCPDTHGWSAKDARWAEKYGVDLGNQAVCPSGGMDSFNYRGFLAAHGWTKQPNDQQNRMSGLWHRARVWRDDRAWKSLCDRIRARAAERGHKVLISGNGIAKYVDLQVLGVWAAWEAKQGRCDFSESQLGHWRQLVQQGRRVAGGNVPVVFFHDWGFGDTPFPFMAVSVADRELWMRIRGPEIYAAGGCFAYPVLGPFGCDAEQDGSIFCIQQQTKFLQTHRDLYLHGQYLGSDALRSADKDLSLALWASNRPRQLALHVINRQVQNTKLVPRQGVTVTLPVKQAPAKVTVISPDWAGERPATAKQTADGLAVTLPELQAYAVVLLSFESDVDVSAVRDPARFAPIGRWAPGPVSEFKVLPDASIENADELNGFQQGMLHKELRNPPTFLVNALGECKLRLKVRAVAASGARIELRVDGQVTQTVDLPDKDGKNDGNAPEYDQEFTFTIPAGRHKVTLDNVGGDWYTLSWIEFEGKFGVW